MLKFRILAGVAVVCAAAACTPKQLATASAVIQKGQLVCKVGPSSLAMVDPAGAAFLASGTPKAVVDYACQTVNGVAISPPASGTADQVATVTFGIPVKS